MKSTVSVLIQEIGQNIKNIREKKNLTQMEVAKSAGLNANYYACIERGEVNPSLEKFIGIIKALKIKASEVLPF